MRVLLFVLLLAACGSPRPGPAWPKDRTAEPDGGESLAPHVATAVELEASDDEPADEPESEPEAADEADAADAEPDDDAAPAVESATEDEPITTEDITIEIDDDDVGGDDGE